MFMEIKFLLLQALSSTPIDRQPWGEKNWRLFRCDCGKNGALKVTESNEDTIRKVLQEDRFEIHQLSFSGNQVSVIVTNTKFRSTAQAIGRVASTLQRSPSDKIEFATIALSSRGLITGKYHVDLEKITTDQFNPMTTISYKPSITAIDPDTNHLVKNNKHFAWGVGPYFSHRLFNPDLPLSMEFGIEIEGTYKLTRGLEPSGALRKSVLTNLTGKSTGVTNSRLPRVHSDWPLYDFEGQGGHIHELNLSYVSNFWTGALWSGPSWPSRAFLCWVWRGILIQTSAVAYWHWY